MARSWNFLFAGFGGQGVLFAGKVAVYTGMLENREVSWLPSYGPEMRGGTANCSVCLSDTMIGSPIVLHPDALVAMNAPSYDKFIATVVPGGLCVMDSSLVLHSAQRTDITELQIPATRLAKENGIASLANLVMLGALYQATGFTNQESLEGAIRKVVPAGKEQLVAENLKALSLGATYKPE
ncbi:MAG: 2-oxoacid:acceptor oxidoreductase family protein [Oscillospiraceae bacterium]